MACTHLLLRGEGEVDDIEARLQALRDDAAAAARRAHRRHQLHVHDVAPRLLCAVVPAAVVDPLAQQLQRRLAAERVLLGHVQVVHEEHQALARRRAHLVLAALFHGSLDDVLHRRRRRCGGEVDGQLGECLAIQLLQLLRCQHRLARARVADQHHVAPCRHQRVGDVLVAHSVRGRHRDLRKGRITGWAPAGRELVSPGPEVPGPRIDPVIVHETCRWEQRLQLSHTVVEAAAPSLVHSCAQRPHARKGEPALQILVVPGASFRSSLAVPVLDGEQAAQQVAQRNHSVEVPDGHQLAALLSLEAQQAGDVLGKQPAQQLRLHGRLALAVVASDPGGHVRLPAQVIDVQVDHARARDGRRGGHGEVLDLKQ